MKMMTQANLQSAFGGESQARNRYNIWGNKAEKDGFKNVARLFNATADAEKIHAALHFDALKDVHGDFAVTSMAGFGIGSTSENLEGARNGEIFEATRAMRFAVEAEKVHAERFGKAKEFVDGGKDLEVEEILLCPICGYIGFEKIDACPICGCKSEKFIEY